MNAQSWFGVGVRLFGCYLTLQSLVNLTFYASVRLDWAAVSSPEGPTEYLLYAVCYAAVGLVVLRNADPIVRFAYPEPGRRPDPAAEEPRPEADVATADATGDTTAGPGGDR